MDRGPVRRPNGSVVLLFGPQALSLQEPALRQLRAAISSTTNPDDAWMRDVVRQLPSYVARLSQHAPDFSSAAASGWLQKFADWIEADGDLPVSPERIPNAVLTPLVVLGHLLQYKQYVEAANVDAGLGSDCWSPQLRHTETLGFCTGLLSALVVSSASSQREFQELGSVAVRLAALAGAIVDAEDARGTHGESKSLSVGWSTAEQKQAVMSVVDADPAAYLSVLYDENRATVTTASASAQTMQRKLREQGALASEIGLYGRFHSGCHQDTFKALLALCSEVPELQFPSAARLVLPSFSTTTAGRISEGSLHEIALREMLLEPCQWHRTFEAVTMSCLESASSLLVSFGPEKCIPPSFSRLIPNERVISMSNWEDAKPRLTNLKTPPAAYSDTDIAVVGMSVKVAGADDLDEFWELMCRGESQHQEVPKERFGFDTQFREVDTKRKWFGNFVRDHDAFDHKFFKKSPREVSSQDPQQRLFLQSAYQAVEQAGYFNNPNPDRRVGVYVGVCAADYEANIACYQPNAFSATGNLKSFIAGKISHYFGWTGPGLTIDTACSASAVAVHQACRAILTDECSAALVGGVNIMTSPLWFQNLAGASFLSQTGACKPFDSKADGYCRGEGIASVFLKKMSQAVQDGDQIIGCIASTAVSQNDNSTPIFVPNAPSLTGLFEKVIAGSGLSPRDISLVEAHGTGTPVGDPAEYESIKKVMGGLANRSSPMPIGSVKGLIGHTECASGLMSLIKTLLMIRHSSIPPQASFQTLSPGLHASPSDMLEVPTRQKAWRPDFHAALINNYGASGSNASMVVTQAPSRTCASEISPSSSLPASVDLAGVKQPLWITGYDARSLREYSAKLAAFLQTRQNLPVADVAFNISRQSNRALPQGLVFSASSTSDLTSKLSDFANGSKGLDVTATKASRPVVLCFGGQTSRTIGLDRKFYSSVHVFRKHIDEVDSIVTGMGLKSFKPDIFEKQPIDDTIKLQSALFAMQYASAMSWQASGVKIAAVVGHSFGELTCLAVTGVLSLHDALAAVVARAKLVQEAWGADSGGMLAVEGDLADVQALIDTTNEAYAEGQGKAVGIACYNTPTSFTLAGPSKAVDVLAEKLATIPKLRGKKLAVSNAFHSTLVEPLLVELEKVGDGQAFREPRVRWERATESSTSASDISAAFFAQHMRQPVFANHAFQRLHKSFPSAIWLEAGSGSTITNMASKALGAPATSYFQALNLTSDASLPMLTDVFVGLWKEGLAVHHWAHHGLQTESYEHLLLPPYQFEKSRHWMELKKPVKFDEKAAAQQSAAAPVEQLPTSLYTFVGYQDEGKRHARFRINTMIKKYEELVTGHVVAQTAPICPATVEVDITIEAFFSLRPDFEAAHLQPEIRAVENLAPICINPARAVWLDLQASDANARSWSWKISSTDAKGASPSVHVKGELAFRTPDDAQLKSDMKRFERLAPHQRCLEVLECAQPDDVIAGRNMYKVFAEIVEYAPPYHGLQKLVGKGETSAGRVVKTHSGQTWLDAHLADCFSQVGGFWVNCMTDRPSTDMYIAAGFESWFRAPPQQDEAAAITTWDVMACHHRSSEKAYTTDIFIYDAASGSLREVILGINYARIPKMTMSKMLLRLTADEANTKGALAAAPSAAARMAAPPIATGTSTKQFEPVSAANIDTLPPPSTELGASTHAAPSQTTEAVEKKASRGPQILPSVIEVLAELTGLEAEDMASSTKLADIGIDSLMGMEMAHELEGKFKCTLDMDALAEVTAISDVVACVGNALGISDSEVEDESDSSSKGSMTPAERAESVTSVSDNDEAVLPPASKPTDGLMLPASTVMEAFGEAKLLTDEFITKYRCSGYMDTINPKQTQLCVALTLEAFEQLGCSLAKAKAGEELQRIPHAPQHSRLAQYLYEMLEEDARLIDIKDGRIVRTGVHAPTKSSQELLKSLVAAYPDHDFANRLAFFCGSRLAEVLEGKLDGVKLIFGNEEGRELVSGLYGDSLLNKLSYKQMEDIITRLASKLPHGQGPLKILEMGAGTGGTTKYLVPLLARLGVDVEYTFTDLAPSFVAAARKKYKEYGFMKFRAHDIEKVPADDLIGTQHIVVASNAVHATHSLPVSTKNIRKALRPDGFLMMLEMTETLRWVDIIFGLLEGWWLFDDGRPHALSHQTRWERELQSVGYGHVDWTDGHLPENNIQRIIIAMASGPTYTRLPVQAAKAAAVVDDTDKQSSIDARKAAVDSYVREYTKDFQPPPTAAEAAAAAAAAATENGSGSGSRVDDAESGTETGSGSGKGSASSRSTSSTDTTLRVLVTGATGSLGCHLVEHLASLPHVASVICLNRAARGAEPMARQLSALADRGIELSATQRAKLHVLASDSSKPQLGLPGQDWEQLIASITHVIHNAWPMSGNRPVRGFEAQFAVMRNLIDLCSAAHRRNARTVGFQFVSSIAVVGHQPLVTGSPLVAEEPVGMEAVLPNGYGDAKYACELMLDATLRAHPHAFRSMSVRLGQVAGSSRSGYWNAQEHLSFLIKSSQTLRAFPAFDGLLSWTPVDLVAAGLSELLLLPRTATDGVYHIDNPVRQPWADMVPVLAAALDIPPARVIPFDEWVARARRFPGSPESDNPAHKLIGFLDGNFERMSCGGLLLDTRRAQAHSPTMAAVGAVSTEVALRYIAYWKRVGFLHA